MKHTTRVEVEETHTEDITSFTDDITKQKCRELVPCDGKVGVPGVEISLALLPRVRVYLIKSY